MQPSKKNRNFLLLNLVFHYDNGANEIVKKVQDDFNFALLKVVVCTRYLCVSERSDRVILFFQFFTFETCKIRR